MKAIQIINYRAIDKIEIAINLLVFLAIAALFIWGAFDPLETDRLGYKTVVAYPKKMPKKEIAIVPVTLQCCQPFLLGWPVKRSVLAKVAERIIDCGARVLVLNWPVIDKTTQEEDEPLIEMIKRNKKRIILSSYLIKKDMPSAINPLKPIQMLMSRNGPGGQAPEMVYKPRTEKELEQPKNAFNPLVEPDFYTPSSLFPPFSTEETGIANFDPSESDQDPLFKFFLLRRKVPEKFSAKPLYLDTISVRAANLYRKMAGGTAGVEFVPSTARFYPNQYACGELFPAMPAGTLLRLGTDEVSSMVRGKIVILGSSCPFVPDIFQTAKKPMTPGSEMHATIISNILNNDFTFRIGQVHMLVIIFLFSLLSYFYLKTFKGVIDILICPAAVYLHFYLTTFSIPYYHYYIDVLPIAALLPAQFIVVRSYQSIRNMYFSNIELQRMVDRLGGLYSVSKLSYQLTDAQKLLNTTVTEIAKILKCLKVSIVLEEPVTKSFVLKAAVGFKAGEEVSENLILERQGPFISKVFETSQPLIIKNSDKEIVIYNNDSKKYFSKSFICVPIIFNSKTSGALSVTDKVTNEDFDEEDLKTITVLANQIASSIEHVMYIAAEVERKRLDKELEIAGIMQKKLVPEGLKSTVNFEIYGRYIPAMEVSGDYYDCIEVDENHLLFVVGDVSGKGVPAGLFMIMARTFLQSIIQTDQKLEKIIEKLNNYLAFNSEPGMFLTLFTGLLDTRNGNIEYVNAGHLPPYIKRANGSIEELEIGNMICGIFQGISFNPGTTNLNEGDTIVVFTDGVTEAQNKNGDLFGEETMKKVFEERCGSEMTSERQVEEILSAVNEFAGGAPQSDDITVLAIRAKLHDGIKNIN